MTVKVQAGSVFRALLVKNRRGGKVEKVARN
jgi:hypothetical protein